jgi:hypothetical protein
VVANPGVTQPGYSFYAEPTGSTVYAVQLHTNNTAVCFAFNQPAYQLIFNLEHTANTYGTSNGKIYVEGSVDLNTWQGIDTLACYNDGRRMDYTITVPDVDYRYLRLRIDNLENSRNIRRINVRSAQVTTYPAEGNPYTFETMPAEWATYQGGTTELSTTHYKHLNQSLKWNWTAGSALRVTNPVDITTASGMCWWIYNETPSATKIRFNLYKGGVLKNYFDYSINFKGWRAFWCYFPDMGMSTTASNPDMIEVKSTSGTNSGTLFFDCVSFSTLIDWSRMNDLFYTSAVQSSSIRDYPGIFNTTRPATTLQPTTTEKSAIDTVATRWEKWLLGSGAYAQNTWIKQKMSSVNSFINSCKANFQSYNITRQPDGSVTGTGLFTDGNPFSPHFYDIYQDVIMGLVLDYKLNGNTDSKDKALMVFDYFYDQGWAEGSGMGGLRFETLRFEGYCHALFLMRKELMAYDPVKYQQQLRALYWMALCGKLFQTGQPVGENADDIRGTSIGILVYALMETDSAKQLQAIKAFTAYMNNACTVASSSFGTFKPDGSGYHHNFVYNTQYATEAFYNASLFIHLLHDTPFALSEQTFQNTKAALCNLHDISYYYDMPGSTGGRFPDGIGVLPPHVSALCLLSSVKPSDTQLQSIAKRMIRFDNSIFSTFVTNTSFRITHETSVGALESLLRMNSTNVTPATEPQLTKYLPFSGLFVSRYNGWLMTMKGFSKYIIDYEYISPDGVVSRYMSNGHQQLSNEVLKLKSYTPDNSWDWSRYPGATAKTMPMSVLKFSSTRGDKQRNYSDEYFLGGTALNDSTGMFAHNLHDNANDKTFRARKSTFSFANIFVNLGTDITNTDAVYNTETTLFQDTAKVSSLAKVNGTSVTATTTAALSSGIVNVTNNWGNTYLVYPYGGGTLEVRHQLQTTVGSDAGTVPSATYDVATINHGKAPTSKGYRYYTLLGANSQKVQYISGAGSPIQVIQQDKYAHVVSQNDHKVTGYAVFEPNVTFATGYLKSSVRPVIAMIKDLNNGYIDIAISDPDMNRVMTSAFNLSTPVTLSLKLRGSFQWASGDANASFSVLNGETTVTATCSNGATYRYHLKNLNATALNDVNAINLNVYPNPCRDKLMLNYDGQSDNLHISVTDLNGRELLANDVYLGNTVIDTSSLPDGLYLLKAIGDKGVFVTKIIKGK